MSLSWQKIRHDKLANYPGAGATYFAMLFGLCNMPQCRIGAGEIGEQIFGIY